MNPSEMSQDDRDNYESLFGHQPEWHTTTEDLAPTALPTEPEDDDEALYRALFGA